MIKSDSLAKLAPALIKAQKKMGVALKDSKNPFFKSKYADLNAIIDAAVPCLNDENIAVLQTPGIENGISVINTVFLHESGEFLIGQTKVVVAKQNDPQAEGSATTYARRYGLQSMAVLKAEDDDGNAGSGKVVAQETKQVDPTPKAITSAKVEATPEEKVVAANPENAVTATASAASAGTATPAPVKKSGPWGAKKQTTAVTSGGGDLY